LNLKARPACRDEDVNRSRLGNAVYLDALDDGVARVVAYDGATVLVTASAGDRFPCEEIPRVVEVSRGGEYYRCG